MSENENAENLMKANEVWPMLGISKNTLYEWCRQGLIPHRRINKRILFPPRHRLLEWVENRCKEGGQQ